MVTLATPLRIVAARAAGHLGSSLDLHTVGDLLWHVPRRYQLRGEITDLSVLPPGEYVTVFARVNKANVVQNRNNPGQRVVVEIRDDGGHTLELVFFWGRRSYQLIRQLSEGRWGLFAGVVNSFHGKLSLAHPAMELLDAPMSPESVLAEFTGPIPVYPATAQVSSLVIARTVRLALDQLDPPDDPLPPAVRLRRGLLSLDSALRQVHRPTELAEVEPARHRLAFDEAMATQVALVQRRRGALALPAVPRPQHPDGLLAAFDDALPFTLTSGQRQVSTEVLAELAGSAPMQRLLAGEVGSGKTVVALRAMLTTIDNGGQAALLAPTEVLASQHARSLRTLLGPLGAAGELLASDLDDPAAATQVVLLTGSMPARARREALAAVEDGSAGIVVGTHALLEPEVRFHDLGLVVVDEQHRFGVEQRDALRARGRRQEGGGEPAVPHLLVMTATPIPRTVAMTVFGDLETSSLIELPAGRQPVSTHVVPVDRPAWLERMWSRVREQAEQGLATFVVCPRIDATTAEGTTPASGGAAVLEVAELLAAGELAGLRVEVLHGRQSGELKEALMTAFAHGAIDVLVATTVVEVGVDVPTATVMVVLDADRFGISQLHQLRGRVGRGDAPGLCFLQTAAEEGTPGRARVERVASTTDGAELAAWDLRLRREGDVLGTGQTGRGRLRLIDPLDDADLIATAREEAIALVAADPTLAHHRPMRIAVERVVHPEDAAYLDKV